MSIERRQATLVNSAGNATRHHYVRSEYIVLGDVTEHQVSGIAHIFECDKTGAQRRFGFDSAADHKADGGTL